MKVASTVALIAALAMTGLAACGSDDEDTSTTSSSPAADTAATGASGEDGASGESGAAGAPCPAADSPPTITDVTSYGANCAAIDDAIAKIGSVSEEFTLGEFKCARTDGSDVGGTWRCDGEGDYFTFEFSD